MTLFFSMVSWIMLVVVSTSCQCFSALASIQQIWVIWALHSTSASFTYKRRVLEDFKHLLITLLTRDSSFIILGRKRSAMAVPCLIAYVAWCRRLLGAFQSRTPICNNNNNEALLIFVWSTTRSHSAPQIIWAHSRLSKYRFRKTSFHQRWCAAVLSSPSLQIPWKVSWVICKILLSVSTSRNKEGSYLNCHWVMSPPRQQGILFIAESSNIAQEPTSG